MSEKKLITNLTLGSDVEFFLQNKNTGEIISAESYVKGTKNKPFNFDESSPFWATSLDNVAYEGNIPPVEKKDDWYGNLTRLRAYIDSTLPIDLCTVTLPSHNFDDKWLQTETAKTFGCDPSYCVWTRTMNNPPEVRTNVRSIGKHIHASWQGMTFEEVEEWVKAMDLFLGIPSVILEPEELSRQRRTLYGKAGEFRWSEDEQQQIKRAEYRSLSSWFAQDKKYCDYTYDQTQRAIQWVEEGNFIDLESPLASEIVTAINTCDKKLAETIIKTYDIPILA